MHKAHTTCSLYLSQTHQIPKMGDWSALDGWGTDLGEWRALKLMKCNWSMDGMHWMNFGVHLG